MFLRRLKIEHKVDKSNIKTYACFKKEANDMRTIYEKLREARAKLGFSQDYVANCLGISRSAITQIELGNRKVNSDELKNFCELYHLSADYLLDTENVDTNQAIFARNFNELRNDDQEEILNLIAFKQAMAKQQQEG